MRTINVFSAMAALAMFAGASYASAQAPCIIVNGVKCYARYNSCQQVVGYDCPEGSTGTAQFRTLSPDDPCGDPDGTEIDVSQPLNVSLQPVSIDVTVPDPNYGTITTTLDDSRASSNTTIVSTEQAKEAGEAFPAQVRIRFYAFATLESEPGKTYVSQTELVFGSDNVRSADPFVNETFTLLNDVNYYDQEDPQQTKVFTLEAGTTSLTIGEGEAPDGDGLR